VPAIYRFAEIEIEVNITPGQEISMLQRYSLWFEAALDGTFIVRFAPKRSSLEAARSNVF